MQPGLDFFRVTLVIEGEEAVEDDAAGSLADRVAPPWLVAWKPWPNWETELPAKSLQP
jgi:hypothetical protein